MKGLAKFAAVVAVFWGAFAFVFPTYTHRYRLTVEADTPDGLRSGSSVVEVKSRDRRWALGSANEYAVRGEAVFVDLGGGRNAVAVLAHGDNAEWVDKVISFWVEAYGLFRWDAKAWSGRRELRGAVELRPALIPTLVTFADPLDPDTVRVVRPGEFEQAFGPGYRFRRATLEMVPAGWWPFDSLGLWGVPVTHGAIDRHLPWLVGMTTNLAGTTSRSTNDIRERLGPLSFKRQDR